MLTHLSAAHSAVLAAILNLISSAIGSRQACRRFLLLVFLIAVFWWLLAGGGVHVLIHEFGPASVTRPHQRSG